MIIEHADLVQFLAQQVGAIATGEMGNEGVGIDDLAGVGIENDDAVLGSLEQAAVTQRRFAQALLGLLQFGRVEKVADHAALPVG